MELPASTVLFAAMTSVFVPSDGLPTGPTTCQPPAPRCSFFKLPVCDTSGSGAPVWTCVGLFDSSKSRNTTTISPPVQSNSPDEAESGEDVIIATFTYEFPKSTIGSSSDSNGAGRIGGDPRDDSGVETVTHPYTRPTPADKTSISTPNDNKNLSNNGNLSGLTQSDDNKMTDPQGVPTSTTDVRQPTILLSSSNSAPVVPSGSVETKIDVLPLDGKRAELPTNSASTTGGTPNEMSRDEHIVKPPSVETRGESDMAQSGMPIDVNNNAPDGSRHFSNNATNLNTASAVSLPLFNKNRDQIDSEITREGTINQHISQMASETVGDNLVYSTEKVTNSNNGEIDVKGTERITTGRSMPPSGDSVLPQAANDIPESVIAQQESMKKSHNGNSLSLTHLQMNWPLTRDSTFSASRNREYSRNQPTGLQLDNAGNYFRNLTSSGYQSGGYQNQDLGNYGKLTGQAQTQAVSDRSRNPAIDPRNYWPAQIGPMANHGGFRSPPRFPVTQQFNVRSDGTNRGGSPTGGGNAHVVVPVNGRYYLIPTAVQQEAQSSRFLSVSDTFCKRLMTIFDDGRTACDLLEPVLADLVQRIAEIVRKRLK